ncbi:YadA-like family protein [Neisseria cinerea]|uniref:YadA-like family protein n=1 Tax=Neisseria cinerea TaxID=483 RepID=UPI000D3368F2|nr:YadA-like family protein [Neisseria cinerea]
MNKIFKVIWNHTTQTWTAVDELASVKGKSKSVKLAAISTALLVAASGVEAANVVSEAGELGQLSIATNKVTNQFFGNKRYQDETGLSNNVAGAKVNAYDGIAIGNGAVSGSPSGTGGNGHVAIGLMAQASAGGANGQNAAVALGAYSLATGQGGTAIGAHSIADGLNSTALGKIAKANNDGATAVGTNTTAEWQGTALGNTAQALGFYATSIGVNSKANSRSSTSIGKEAVVSGENAIGIGTQTKVNGAGTVAVGSNTNVSSKNVSTLGSNITVPAGRDGAVVLGHGSDASKDTDVIAVHSAKIGEQSKLTYTGFAGDLGGTNNKGKNKPAAEDKQGNFVSIGSEDNERQIKHVAAGRITADSTDALNGSQLYQVAKTLGNAAEGLADTLGVGLNEDGTIENKFSQPLTTAEGSNYTAPPAAGDVKTALTNLNNYVNAGWNVTASGNDYKNNVSVGHTVNFVGLGNVDVDGVNEENGVRTINISSDSPIDYATTKAEVDGKEVDVVKANDGKWYPKDKVDEDNNPKEGAKSIPSSDIVKKGAKLTDSDTENNPYEKGNAYTYDDEGNITATGYDKTKPESKDEITAGKNGVQLNNVGWATQPDQAVNKDQLDQTVNKSGFYVQQNGKSTLDAKTDSDKVSDTEKVTPNDVVNFVNGNGTVIKAVTTRDANGVDTTNVTFNVDMAEITPDSDGSVNGPVPQNLLDALDAAQAKVDENPDDEEAKKALEAAQDAVNKAGGNKVANAQNVADMINSSGFTLKTSATADGKKESGDDEIINPGKTVEMIAGKNLTVKQEANGKVTYSMKDDVEFTSVKVGEDKDGKKPVNFTTVKATDASNNDPANQPTTALNVSSSDGKPTQITGVGSTLNVKPVDTNPNGTPTADADKPNLVDLVGTDAAPVNKNAAATVGDLQNMGWVVSTEKGNGYKDVVKNANQVEFKGTGLATVTGETDKDGIRTITVNVDAQKAVEAIQTPVVYTNKDGNKLVKVGDKFYKAGDVVNGKPQENAKAVPNGDVIASMSNGDNNTSKPMQLANIGSNLPTVNDTNKQAFDPNSTTPKAGKDNKSAPITAEKAADIVNKAGNNAATVSDVLNAGWNLQNNGEARDFVKPYDTVNFINGKGTVAVVETADDAASSTVKFDVDAGEITSNTNGSVNGPTTAENAKKLADDLKKAEQAVKDLPANATPEAKKAAQDALKAAQDAAAPLNKVATAQNVAEAINNSGWRTNSTTADGAKDTLINPGKAVNFESGKNMKVAQTVDKDGNVAYTYATKDDVQFNSVQLGGDNGPKLTNDGKDLKVSGSNGTPVKITNVADGNISADSKDAVNGSQLHATNQSINRLGDTVNNIGGNVTRLSDKVDNMDRDYRAGIAGSNAAASLPQVYLPGKSMVAAAAGTFKGQNALAVGYSSISDNGKLIWKAQANLNSRADVGVGVGMGYLW